MIPPPVYSHMTGTSNSAHEKAGDEILELGKVALLAAPGITTQVGKLIFFSYVRHLFAAGLQALVHVLCRAPWL